MVCVRVILPSLVDKNKQAPPPVFPLAQEKQLHFFAVYAVCTKQKEINALYLDLSNISYALCMQPVQSALIPRHHVYRNTECIYFARR